MNTIKKIVSVSLLAAFAVGMSPLAAGHGRLTRAHDGVQTRAKNATKGYSLRPGLQRLRPGLQRVLKRQRDLTAKDRYREKQRRVTSLVTSRAGVAVRRVQFRTALRARHNAQEALLLADVAPFFYRDEAGVWRYVGTNQRPVRDPEYLEMLDEIAARAQATVAVPDAVAVVAGNAQAAQAAGMTEEQVHAAVDQATAGVNARLADVERSNRCLKIVVCGVITVVVIGAVMVWYYWPAIQAAMAARSFVASAVDTARQTASAAAGAAADAVGFARTAANHAGAAARFARVAAGAAVDAAGSAVVAAVGGNTSAYFARVAADAAGAATVAADLVSAAPVGGILGINPLDFLSDRVGRMSVGIVGLMKGR